MYICIGNKEKDAMNLKKNKKGYMGELEGRKENREMRYYNFNTYIIYVYLKYILKSLEPCLFSASVYVSSYFSVLIVLLYSYRPT